MVAINLKERFRNGELDLSSCGLKEIPKDIVSIPTIHYFTLVTFTPNFARELIRLYLLNSTLEYFETHHEPESVQ